MMKIRNILLALALLPLAIQAQQWREHSVLSQGTWYRIGVEETGVYRLSPAHLPALQGLAFSHLALYAGDARQQDPAVPIASGDDLQPLAAEVVDRNGNGLMDADDALLFFAEGTVSWRYDEALASYTHQRHAYASRRRLFLRVDAPAPCPLPVASEPEANAQDVGRFDICALYEQELSNPAHSGQAWMGEKFTPGNSRGVSVPLPCPATAPLRVRLALASPDGAGRFSAATGGDSQSFALDSREKYATFRATFNSASPAFSLAFSASGASAGYLDFIELTTHTAAVYGGTPLLLHAAPLGTAGTAARHLVDNGGAELSVWDVTNPLQPKKMPSTTSGRNTLFAAATAERRTFVVFAPGQAPAPDEIAPLDNQDLHGAAAADMVIVVHPRLRQAAERLANLHRVVDNLEVLVVSQEEIFNEFSSGQRDPMALREFMRLMHSHQERPVRYLLLLGKGTYDNRDLLALGLPTVVTYHAPVALSDDCSLSATDDIYGCLAAGQPQLDGSALSIAIGRLPAKSEQEANHLVDKIERYLLRLDLEQSDARGDWRTYACLLADDADPSQTADVEFARSSEHLATRIEEQNPWVNIDKIYADAYRQQSGTIGSYYPDVNNALRQRINYGCLMLNYIGHGSEQYIGTERYMELGDIDNYSNLDRLPFFVTSTCSFGKFDKLDGLCGSEAFLLAPGAGIGCVAAARPISHMRAFNTDLFTGCLNPANTVGDALRQAKRENPLSQNRAIALMGDPALRLSFPENEVVVTAINGTPVSPGQNDSAQVLSRVTVEGEIRDHNGLLQSQFEGAIFPIVFDRPTQCRTLANDNEGTEVEFTQQKNVLYKGRDTVSAGRFRYSFIVPRDVAYQYAPARLSHYARSTALGTDAAGAYTHLLLGGFDPDADLSESRPSIRLFMGDTTFLNGDIVDPDATLLALLHDSLGINAVGSGLGHDITALLDGNVSDPLILNDFYQSDMHNPLLGSIRYQLQNLAPGRHTLTLKAWNIYNYSASASIDFTVRGADSLAIGLFRAYPNPSAGPLTLHASHNAPGRIAQAIFEIYDLRGRRVATLQPTPAEGSYTVTATLDLSHLPQGTYLARAILTTDDAQTLTATTKIVRPK